VRFAPPAPPGQLSDDWSQNHCSERAAWLLKLAGALKERASKLRTPSVRKSARPISDVHQHPSGIAGTRHQTYAQLITELKFEQESVTRW